MAKFGNLLFKNKNMKTGLEGAGSQRGISVEYSNEIRDFAKSFDDPERFNEVVDEWVSIAEQYDEPGTFNREEVRKEMEQNIREAINKVNGEEAGKAEKFWERVTSIAQEVGCPQPLSLEELDKWSYLYYTGLKEAKEKFGEDSEKFASMMKEYQELSRREALYHNYRVNTNIQSLGSGYVYTDWTDDDIRSTLESGWKKFEGMTF